jgi:hypothetical protein
MHGEDGMSEVETGFSLNLEVKNKQILLDINFPGVSELPGPCFCSLSLSLSSQLEVCIAKISVSNVKNENVSTKAMKYLTPGSHPTCRESNRNLPNWGHPQYDTGMIITLTRHTSSVLT